MVELLYLIIFLGTLMAFLLIIQGIIEIARVIWDAYQARKCYCKKREYFSEELFKKKGTFLSKHSGSRR